MKHFKIMHLKLLLFGFYRLALTVGRMCLGKLLNLQSLLFVAEQSSSLKMPIANTQDVYCLGEWNNYSHHVCEAILWPP